MAGLEALGVPADAFKLKATEFQALQANAIFSLLGHHVLTSAFSFSGEAGFDPATTTYSFFMIDPVCA